MKPNPTKIL